MPTTEKTLKELRDSLKTLQKVARTLQEAQYPQTPQAQYYRGRSDGIEAARRLVEQLCR